MQSKCGVRLLHHLEITYMHSYKQTMKKTILLFLCFLHKAGCHIGKRTSVVRYLETKPVFNPNFSPKKKWTKYKVGKVCFICRNIVCDAKTEASSFWSSASRRSAAWNQTWQSVFWLYLSQKQKLWCLTVWLCLYLVSLEQGCALPSALSTVRVGSFYFLWLHKRLIFFICYLRPGHQHSPLHTHTVKKSTSILELKPLRALCSSINVQLLKRLPKKRS